MSAVRTVLGDVPAAGLGRVDYHEHLFQVSPLLPGDELTDEQASGEEARALRDSGFEAMVDATPVGLGRRPAALAAISARTGLTVVATTGAHRAAHHVGQPWLLEASVDSLAARFRGDVVEGMPADDGPRPGEPARGPSGPVRAGLLKAGIDYWSITPFARRVLAAVAQVHGETGAPVMVHLEHGSAAFELLELLAGEGVAADAVALAHVDRNPDPGLHAELAATGAHLGYDGPARHASWPDATILDCLLAVAGRGGADRLLLGGDVARATRYVAYGGMPGLAYLGQRFVPRLLAEGGPELVQAVLVTNPARWLGRFPVTNTPAT
ncbi:phosphotriesterase [Modestobacter sp. SSW1-42]|uniref:phosphotriesterase family protein n=1 Tax=Modestobacter sp. SSW1-42 TaxID=596372 RepID=UPI00398780D7